ncbi:3'-5' exonuclease eri-1-like isoform X5 [Mauremys mutica]|uniref:3'-5' exonuclease eri-1-like isoform X5 n=1 Tax=Mauremys mutica TaxID=74926 RepID=UPI001D14BB9F|nr:3'-5' exonuclease eri-1-like isoform X5 [Mauremys mutica]
MATKQLARQLGLIRKSSITSSSGKNQTRTKSRQLFDYLIIIDFESTCWKDGKRHYSQEIIEFPAVLLNTSTGEIESEFHMYVQPQEHPILSEFCTELTGIKQNQVDEGVPLNICLSQFSKWIQKIQKEKKIIFNSDVSSHSVSEAKSSTFVTWSDWDLGVCLQYECKRKQLRKPDILNSWIDLRATYKLFYTRKPKGLNGALQDLGIEFAGREHSGLDDSRNTARLAWRMICDGCVMKITRSLDKFTDQDGRLSGSEEEEDDVEAALKKEVDQIRTSTEQKLRRFQSVESGANNVVFIRTLGVEPENLVHHILKDLHTTKKKKTRVILRMLPISGTCKAFVEDMKKYSETFFEPWFKAPNKGTFQIVYKARNNSHMSREEVIKELAGIVGSLNPENKVDLNNPQYTIVVEIIKNVCCLSVVKDYVLFRKYNLQEVVKSNKEELVQQNLLSASQEEKLKEINLAEEDSKEVKPEDKGQSEEESKPNESDSQQA